MKFNLKNRPSPAEYLRLHGNVAEIDWKDYTKNAYKWFEGFEKQLRSGLIQNTRGLSEANKLFVKGYQFALKEILGDEK